MRKRQFFATLCLASSLSGPAFANAALAESRNCMACHDVDKKLLGPAFKDVAFKYAGQKDAEAKLVRKVLKGGGGVWGKASMPPNSISEDEARTLVKWVLLQKSPAEVKSGLPKQGLMHVARHWGNMAASQNGSSLHF